MSQKQPTYDLVIVGGGPAGLTAAIYAARFNIKCVIITDRVGGLLNEAGVIDDYPGMPEIQATTLINRLKTHVERYNVPIVSDVVISFSRVDQLYEVRTKKGATTKTYAIILAIGTRRRTLGIPGEVEFRGRGVSYCSVCDAAFFKGAAAVAVVGGADLLRALKGEGSPSGFTGLGLHPLRSAPGRASGPLPLSQWDSGLWVAFINHRPPKASNFVWGHGVGYVYALSVLLEVRPHASNIITMNE